MQALPQGQGSPPVRRSMAVDEGMVDQLPNVAQLAPHRPLPLRQLRIMLLLLLLLLLMVLVVCEATCALACTGQGWGAPVQGRAIWGPPRRHVGTPAHQDCT